MVANFFFGLSVMMVFVTTTTMLTEFVPKKASNGVAVNNFIKSIFSCVGGVIAEPAIKGLGNGWMCTILGVVCMASGVAVIIATRRNMNRWREHMDKALADD